MRTSSRSSGKPTSWNITGTSVLGNGCACEIAVSYIVLTGVCHGIQGKSQSLSDTDLADPLMFVSASLIRGLGFDLITTH